MSLEHKFSKSAAEKGVMGEDTWDAEEGVGAGHETFGDCGVNRFGLSIRVIKIICCMRMVCR
jgi:hypothetical protein